MNKKEKKLEYLLSLAKRNGSITNWHLSDDLAGFVKEFYSGDIMLSTAKAHFTRYARMLVKMGLLEKPVRLSLGNEFWFAYNAKTQTCWRLKTND